MTRTLLRAGALSCALLASTALTAPALAQTTVPIDAPAAPVHQEVDQNGVDLVTGVVRVSQTDVSIGPDDHRGLRYTRVRTSSGWRDNLVATIGGNENFPLVSFGGRAEQFELVSGAYVSKQGSGARLTRTLSTFTYTSDRGVVVQFQRRQGNYFSSVQNLAWVSTVTWPDGTRQQFNWIDTEWCTDPTEPVCPNYRNATRLQSVTNNLGYQLKYEYASDVLDGPGQIGPWQRLARVTAINNAVEYCNPFAHHCTLTGSWPSASYATTASGGDTLFSVTDPGGGVTRYRTNGVNLTGIKRPTSASDDVSYVHDLNGRVTSAATPAGTWTYAYVDGATTRTTTVTNPLSQSYSLVSNLTTRLVVSATDALSRTTSYSYDSSERLQRITRPEGNYTELTYDGRGNVTETRTVAKPSTGLADIVTSATYPDPCANPVTCNLPATTTDARGQVTEYSYDATHGGVLSITLPAASGGGTRPQVRTSYATHQAYYRNISGSIVASGSNIYLPTQVSACQTGSAPSCLGTADEVRTTVSYGPQSAGTANNLLAVSATAGAGDGSLTATTATAYDAIGNVTSVDGPLAGSADTTAYRYDVNRRQVGTISPDPDGGGPLLRRAQRTTFSLDGVVIRAEQGTVAGTSDPDWAAFSPLQTVDITRDAALRPVRRTLTAGGSLQAVTDLSYDGAGRSECSATRMNPAAWAALTNACTLQATGSNGPDRISRTYYDAAGQATSSRNAFGTADEAVIASSSYRPNGQVETVTDGENNRTTYVYDGHDRLSQTQFPSSTQGAGSSNASDYEQLGYDAAGNVTSWRLRDGTSIAFTYDNLNRMTLRDTPNAVWQDADISYAYDLLGRTTAITSPIGTNLAFGYDALGRQVSEASYYGTKTMQYDLAGRMTRLTWPDAFYVTYDHLVTGEVTAIREQPAGSGLVLGSYAYDDLGRRTSLTRGNGTSTSYGYDNASRLASLVNDFPGTSGDLTLGFSYNPAGQITSNTRSNDGYAFTAHANQNVTDTVNGLNQVTATGATGVSHDARGNVTAIGGVGYGYTSENRMVSGGGTPLLYDPAGRLMLVYAASGEQRLDMLGHTLITELDSSHNVTRRYVHGPGTDEPLVWYEGAGTSDRRWFHADERGSITAVSNGSGVITQVNRYDEYGRPASGNAGRFGYTGQVWLPELGLSYYRARLFNSELGRFMQTDPIGYGGGMNLYAYVGGDPVNRTDPSGLHGDQCNTTTNVCKSKDDSIFTGSNTGRECTSCSVSYSWGPMAQAGPSMRSGGGLAAAAGRAVGYDIGIVTPSGARLVCTTCGQPWQEDPATGDWVITAPQYRWVYSLSNGLLQFEPFPTNNSEPTPRAPAEQRPAPAPFDPRRDWCGSESNGTGWVPEGNWAEACWVHDNCYGTPGASKPGCDLNLWRNMTNACSLRGGNPTACSLIGFSYSLVLTFGGWGPYNAAQRGE